MNLSRIFACFFLFLRENEKSLTDIVEDKKQSLNQDQRNVVPHNLICGRKDFFNQGLCNTICQQAANTNVYCELDDISCGIFLFVKGEAFIQKIAENAAQHIIGGDGKLKVHFKQVKTNKAYAISEQGVYNTDDYKLQKGYIKKFCKKLFHLFSPENRINFHIIYQLSEVCNSIIVK